MERLYKIRKGLDLNLKGEAAPKLQTAPAAAEYAVSPSDFHGVVPRLLVKEGAAVKAGDPLFTDKATERIMFVSPVSGTVSSIERGERRKLLYIHIEADASQQLKKFEVPDLAKATADDVLSALLESGLFGFVRQRPYDVVASPTDKPKGIFVSTFNKMPLAADFSFTIKGKEEEFKEGIKALSKLAKVHLGICPEQINTPMLPVAEAEVSVFDGPNPSGNVGVQINHINPVNKGEVVWTVDPAVVVMIGHLFKTGETSLTRRVAVAGSKISDPQYVETLIGTPMAHLLNGLVDSSDDHARIINGNPLVGAKSSLKGYLAAFASEVCVIPEGDDVHEAFGWIAPRLNDYSTHHSYLSWLLPHSKKYDLDCRVKGGQRHMIMSGEYDRVFPMDIYAGYLVKAILTGNIDKQEELGIYEVAPEDFALAEFVDSSKLELQRIVREGLDLLRKENS